MVVDSVNKKEAMFILGMEILRRPQRGCCRLWDQFQPVFEERLFDLRTRSNSQRTSASHPCFRWCTDYIDPPQYR